MNYRTKNLINISVVVLIFIVMTVYFLAVDGIDNIISVLKTVNISWALIGLALIILYWLLEALCLYIVEKKIYKKQKFINSLKVSMIGQLFNSLTPFSSGGQPMQAVAMKCEGKSVSKSATILLIKFIVYQATLVIYTALILIFEYSYFRNSVSGFVKLAIIGFIVNFLVIVTLILIGAKKSIVLKFLSFIYKLLGKIKILKNLDKKIEELRKSVDTFHENFKIIKKEKIMVLKLFLATALQLTVFFSITYAVYKMFGLSGTTYIKIISAQSFLSMVMAFVPIPGAGIAAEGGFYIIFGAFIPKEVINMAILFWRLYTFYLPIIVGSFFMLKMNKKENLLLEAEKEEG